MPALLGSAACEYRMLIRAWWLWAAIAVAGIAGTRLAGIPLSTQLIWPARAEVGVYAVNFNLIVPLVAGLALAGRAGRDRRLGLAELLELNGVPARRAGLGPVPRRGRRREHPGPGQLAGGAPGHRAAAALRAAAGLGAGRVRRRAAARADLRDGGVAGRRGGPDPRGVPGAAGGLLVLGQPDAAPADADAGGHAVAAAGLVRGGRAVRPRSARRPGRAVLPAAGRTLGGAGRGQHRAAAGGWRWPPSAVLQLAEARLARAGEGRGPGWT